MNTKIFAVVCAVCVISAFGLSYEAYSSTHGKTVVDATKVDQPELTMHGCNPFGGKIAQAFNPYTNQNEYYCEMIE